MIKNKLIRQPQLLSIFTNNYLQFLFILFAFFCNATASTISLDNNDNTCVLDGSKENTMSAEEFADFVLTQCDEQKQYESLTMSNLIIDCGNDENIAQMFNITSLLDVDAINDIIIKSTSIFNCDFIQFTSARSISVDDVTIIDFVVYSEQLLIQPLSKYNNCNLNNYEDLCDSASSVNKTSILNIHTPLSIKKNKYNSTTLSQIIKNKSQQEQFLQDNDINGDENEDDGDSEDNDMVYSMITPTSRVVFESPKVTIDGPLTSEYLVVIDTQKLIFDGNNSKIIAGLLAIYSRSFLQSDPVLNLQQAKIQTTNIKCVNSIIEASRRDHYNNFIQIDFATNTSEISIPTFKSQNQLHQYLFDTLTNNYTLLILTKSNVTFTSSRVYTSKLGLFGNYIYVDNNSILSTSGLGCPSDQGQGSGIQFGSNPFLGCTASGAHHQTYGGIGLPFGYQNNITETISACYKQYNVALFVSGLYPYDQYHITEGSGGGLNQDPVEIDFISSTLGSGGGFIYIGAAVALNLDGGIFCDGQVGAPIPYMPKGYFGGGGSGGSVKIVTTNLIGTGQISSNGGDSCEDGSAGEGAGGIIDINLVNQTQIGSQIYYYSGALSVQKGQRNLNVTAYPNLAKFLAQNGMMTIPFCPTGYESMYPLMKCSQCSQNSYKDTLYGSCQECPSPPQGQTLTQNLETGQYCILNCDQIICDPYGFYMRIVSPLGLVILQTTLSILTTGYVIRRIYRLKKGRIDHLPFDFEEATEKMRLVDKIITTDLQNDPNFNMVDLLFHTHRINVIGQNGFNNSWKLHKRPPSEVEYIINKEQFYKFAERFNQTVKWKQIDKILLMITSLIYYPLYWYLFAKKRKAIYQRARKFFDQTELQIINLNLTGHFDKVQIKLSKSNDYTQCYFDIFDYTQSNFKYFFLKIPYFIQLSGDGSFIQPFHINENDVFCKCLYFSVNRNMKIDIKDERQRVMENLVNHKLRIDNSKLLNKFLSRFNRYMRSIDFMAPESLVAMSLEMSVNLLNEWNRDFFCWNSVGVNLVVLEVPKRKALPQMVTVLQNNDQASFKQFVSRICNIIHQRSNDYEIKFSLFLFNLDSPIHDVSNAMEDQRINISNEGANFYRVNNNSTILEDIHYYKDKLQNQEQFNMSKMSMLSRNSIIEENEFSNFKKTQQSPNQCLNSINRAAGFIRFALFTHSPTKLTRPVLIFSLTSLILLDTVFTIASIFNVSYQIKIFPATQMLQDFLFLLVPYTLSPWISPVLGLLLITSQSYGIAKLYIIYNSLSLANIFLNVIWTVKYDTPPSSLPLVYSLKIISFIIRLGILYLASKYLSLAAKLTHLNTQKGRLS